MWTGFRGATIQIISEYLGIYYQIPILQLPGDREEAALRDGDCGEAAAQLHEAAEGRRGRGGEERAPGGQAAAHGRLNHEAGMDCGRAASQIR